MSHPSFEVLTAFGVKADLEPLSGGRGLCFKADSIVLRPVDDEEESQWIAEFITNLNKTCPTTAYRLPAPIATTNQNPPSFVKSGWTASSFLPGRPLGINHVKDTLAVCRAFHADVARLNLKEPPFLDGLTDRFHIADRVTWGELSLESVDVLHRGVLADIQTHLDAFKQLMRPFSDQPARQLIHGDMAGNILFDTDGRVAPGIIDQTPYWRPAEYAEAIIVADGLIWDGKGQELIDELGSSEYHLQLLVRALYYRCLTFAINSDMAFVVPMLPKTKFASAARAVYEARQAVGSAKKESTRESGFIAP
jgi:uncharacterized protein (TIGR02569 family)